MPHRQKLATKAKMLLRCREALKLVGEGLRLSEVSARMGVHTASVKRYVSRALETESMFPSSLDGQQIAQLRQLEGERLERLGRHALAALCQVQARLGTEGEKGLDATAVARLIAAATQVSERKARLFGLDAPTKVIAEMLQVSYHKTDHKVTISFDRSPIETLARQPVAGLTITANGSANAARLDYGDRAVPLDRLDVPEAETAPGGNVESAA